MEHEPPVHELKEGAVKAAIWARAGKNGRFYQASFVRLFKDDETGEWRDSQSFGERDLENLAKVASQAYGWIQANKRD
jgi:hypothetical protein